MPPVIHRLWVHAIAIAAITAAVTGCNYSAAARRNEANAKVQEGRQLLYRGLTDEALVAFEKAIEYDPKLASAHMGVGDIRRGRGHYEDARLAYESAARLAPTSFHAHYYLGLMRQLVGRVAEAVTAYLQALAIDPDNFYAHRNLAGAYVQLGRPADALPYARRAVALKASSQAAWANLGTAYSMLGQYDEAVGAYRQAVELGEQSEPILLGLADAQIKLGRYELALNVLRQLVRQQPSAAAHQRMGYARFRMRKYDDALASYQMALAITPSDVAALNGIGVCLMTLYIQGERTDATLRDQALDSWRRSLRLQPKQPKIIDLVTRYQRL